MGGLSQIWSTHSPREASIYDCTLVLAERVMLSDDDEDDSVPKTPPPICPLVVCSPHLRINGVSAGRGAYGTANPSRDATSPAVASPSPPHGLAGTPLMGDALCTAAAPSRPRLASIIVASSAAPRPSSYAEVVRGLGCTTPGCNEQAPGRDDWQTTKAPYWRRKVGQAGSNYQSYEAPLNFFKRAERKCFNCFSSHHFVSICTQPTKCWCCLLPGHRENSRLCLLVRSRRQHSAAAHTIPLVAPASPLLPRDMVGVVNHAACLEEDHVTFAATEASEAA
ncbi:hypothetical protein ZWY2020_014980 [Hordeum vulgare]|nr:hypothetical protein ZWY2020_014980 [Hordeum vulgare]